VDRPIPRRRQPLKILAYVGALLGLALLVVLAIRANLPSMLHTLAAAGWSLLWLIPYRALFFLLYAIGWLCLLRPYDPQRRAGLGYLFWVTTVREGIDRLLPVASVGGGVAGVRLLCWRALPLVPVTATVIVEILLTLLAYYLFTAVGLWLLLDLSAAGHAYRHLLLAFLLSLPVPVVMVLLLRYGSVFKRLHNLLLPVFGFSSMSEGAVALDAELSACLRRGWSLSLAAALQLLALISGSFEIWFALRLFGHPIGAEAALVLESMTQAMRHLAFVVPAGLGVQEAGFVIFGQALGIGGELALAVSMAKRLREVLCGLPALISWQWLEGRRLRAQMRSSG
jgi:putative membrane protein